MQGILVLPGMWHIRALIESVKSKSSGSGAGWAASTYSFKTSAERRKALIDDLCKNYELIETVENALVQVRSWTTPTHCWA